jgi:hypothetical protein
MLSRHKALIGYTVYVVGKPIVKATQTRLFPGKSQQERLVGSVTDSLDSLSDGLTKSKARKAGLIAAAGFAGLTAASAGISSLRRREDGANDDS